MGGVRPPRDWLQRQKKAFMVKVLVANALILAGGFGASHFDLIKRIF